MRAALVPSSRDVDEVRAGLRVRRDECHGILYRRHNCVNKDREHVNEVRISLLGAWRS